MGELVDRNNIYTTTNFTGEPGHTAVLASRGTDRAMNKEAQHGGDGETNTTFFVWLASGAASDNTGVPVSAMDITVSPPAPITNPSDINGNYSAYLAENPEIKTITWLRDGYGALPATDYGMADASVDVYLPPLDNIMQDFGFESDVLPGSWQSGGRLHPP